MSRPKQKPLQEPSLVEFVKRRVAYLKKRLNSVKGEWMRISKDTGVNHSTIYRIANDRHKNHELTTLQTLLDWFYAYDKARPAYDNAQETMRKELSKAMA